MRSQLRINSKNSHFSTEWTFPAAQICAPQNPSPNWECNPKLLGTNMAAAKTAVPAAVAAIGGLLGTEDADAGFLRPFAREFVGYKPLVRGDGAGTFLSFGKDQQTIDNKIKLLMQVMEPDMGSKRGRKTFQDFIHQKTNYDDWSRFVEVEDQSLRGEKYKAGLDAFLEHIIEVEPRLEPYAKSYANDRLYGDANTVLRKSGASTKDYNPKPKEQGLGHVRRATQSRGLLDDGTSFTSTPGAPGPSVSQVLKNGRKKAGRASLGVGAPGMGEGLLQAQYHNHEMAVDQNMRDLGVSAKDPMYEYGSLLPVRSNIVTGEREMAMPDIGRDMLRGLLSLGNAPKTGVYNPQSILDVVL